MFSPRSLIIALILFLGCAGAVARGSLFTNGGVESTACSGCSYATSSRGSNFLDPWIPSGEGDYAVQVIGLLWSAAEGDQSVQLFGWYGGEPTTISQTLATSPGVTYTIRFSQGGYPAKGGGSVIDVTVSAPGVSRTSTTV